MSHILYILESHSYFDIVEYHYFRVISKFSLSRSKNDKICFLIFKVSLFAVNKSNSLQIYRLIYSQPKGLEIFFSIYGFRVVSK